MSADARCGSEGGRVCIYTADGAAYWGVRVTCESDLWSVALRNIHHLGSRGRSKQIGSSTVWLNDRKLISDISQLQSPATSVVVSLSVTVSVCVCTYVSVSAVLSLCICLSHKKCILCRNSRWKQSSLA